MQRNPQLQIRQGALQPEAILGLPLPVLALAMLISLFGTGLLLSSLGLLLGLVAGGLLTLLVLKPLQAIHKDDVLVWQLWLRAYQSSCFTSHLVSKRAVYIHTQHQLLTFKQWRLSQ